MSHSNMSHAPEILRCIAHQPAIRLAIVFGSIAAGRATAASDLDLAVAAARPLSAEEKSGLVASLAEATGRPVDLVDLATANAPLLGRVLSTGRVLLNLDPGLYAEFIKRAIYDDADLAPHRQRILEAQRRRWTAA
jgi:predicted nucleotidyltransferase